MELGLEFSDEDFAEQGSKSDAEKCCQKSYNAKICPPLWFLEADLSDRETAPQLLKFRADYYYHQGHYKQAATQYTEALDVLSSRTYTSVRRDMTESLALCHLHLGQYEEALTLVHNLRREATTQDQTVQTLSIWQQIQHRMGDFTGELLTLQQLITAHPFSALYWHRLTECYKMIPRQPADAEIKDQKIDVNTYVPDRILLTCLIRTRLLLRNVHYTCGSFVKSSNITLMKQVDEEIDQLGHSQSVVDEVTEFLRKDLVQTAECGSDTSGDSVESREIQVPGELESTAGFEKQWFSWMLKRDKT